MGWFTGWKGKLEDQVGGKMATTQPQGSTPLLGALRGYLLQTFRLRSVVLYAAVRYS